MNEIDRELLRKYSAGLLNEAEEESFELRLLENPKFAEDVNLEQMMREGLLAADPATFSARPRRSPIWFSLAAGVLLGAISMQLYTRNQLPDQPTSVANPPRIVFDTLRGEAQEAKTELDTPNATMLIIEVAVPMDALEIYLLDQALRIGPLTPDADGFVRAIVAAQPKRTWEISYKASNGENRRVLR